METQENNFGFLIFLEFRGIFNTVRSKSVSIMPPLMQVQDDNDDSCHGQEESFSCASPLSTPKDTRKTVVRFHPTVAAQATLCRDDYTSEEKRACFYTAEEKSQRWLEHEELIDLMEQQLQGGGHGHDAYIRGLEGYTKEGQRMVDINIASCVQRVLELDGSNPQKVAEASRKVSQYSVEFAIAMADYDTEQALLAYESMEMELEEVELEPYGLKETTDRNPRNVPQIMVV
eukprot:scaffold10302_cov118-Cylindrotheca_fusiformis.AAC.7